MVLSVLVHGATAEPLAARYAGLLSRRAADRADPQVPGMADRRLIRRIHPVKGDTPGQERR